MFCQTTSTKSRDFSFPMLTNEATFLSTISFIFFILENFIYAFCITLLKLMAQADIFSLSQKFNKDIEKGISVSLCIEELSHERGPNLLYSNTD